ncbi:LysR family transcriptional regulator [Bdellovibrio svalbardensis]|uniref:LysR family transcriptional regulator n=1 Tax=Bdellovibrio svalbardensis TaxID=2972972 RepID=A0ABT6DMJ6_9BACT|nr:LysR family transcriptional regulator [Bdellovibrio svalbardensis]MDG0818023.1 LysR family transcriptional regulator [Bdellovibrio svalbardensis]
MDINVLKFFKTIANLGNMSRAAQELHVSQPTLTVAMRKLEDQLGVRLFERSKKGVTLTAAGLQIYQYSDQMVELWEEMLREAGTVNDAVRGTIRLGLHPSVARYALPTFLPSLMKEHPDLSVQLSHDLSRNVLQRVLDHALDAGLVMNPEKHPDLILKEICRDEVSVWKKKGSSLQDVLIYDPSLFQTQWILEKLQKKGLRYKRKLESSNLEVIAGLLQAGAGHAILPKRVALQNPFPLEEAHASLPSFQDHLYLVYRPSLRRSAIGKAFIEAVQSAPL